MDSVTTLRALSLHNQVREVGINPNCWYPVAWSDQLPGDATAVMVWQIAIVFYRDHQGHLQALEDACPHKGVALYKDTVLAQNLACPYHGWQFDDAGEWVHSPYLSKEQKLPCAQSQSYPVQEQDGIVWLFPSNPNQSTLEGVSSLHLMRLPVGPTETHSFIIPEGAISPVSLSGGLKASSGKAILRADLLKVFETTYGNDAK